MRHQSWTGLVLFCVLLVLVEYASAGRRPVPYPHLSRRNRELEYFPGVGLVEPLGLLVVASLPLFVLFSTMWLILPIWLKLTHFGLFSHGVLPGVVPPGVAPGIPAAGRRRRSLMDEPAFAEAASSILKALQEGLQKYS